MELSLINLSTTLDTWSETGAASITESDDVLILDGLTAENAQEALRYLGASTWHVDIEDNAQSEVTASQLTKGYEPYRLTIAKSGGRDEEALIVTKAGLRQWFAKPTNHSVVLIACANQPFETWTVRIAPWGDQVRFRPKQLEADPRAVVKETGTVRLVEANISRWVLRRDSPLPWDDPAFAVWAAQSAPVLLRALASEIVDGVLVFKGPPAKRLEIGSAPIDDLGREGFSTLQDCSLWVIENEREHEARHGLFAAEFARSSSDGRLGGVNLRKDGKDALEGAKIAYQLNLLNISRDALRAMGDLRKTVSDEASKLSDSSRQLATAVAGALFGGIGLIIARLTFATPGPALSIAIALIGLVLALYVAAMIWTGVSFMRLQRSLREQWRTRLYRFLPETEYDAMVNKPATDAETSFILAARVSGALSVALLVAFLLVAFVLE